MRIARLAATAIAAATLVGGGGVALVHADIASPTATTSAATHRSDDSRQPARTNALQLLVPSATPQVSEHPEQADQPEATETAEPAETADAEHGDIGHHDDGNRGDDRGDHGGDGGSDG